MRTPRRPNCLAWRSDAEEALQHTEGNFSVGLALGGETRLFDEIEEVAIPVVHSTMRQQPEKALAEPPCKLILAGGLGTRIFEEAYLRLKPLIEIAFKPIWWHILKILFA